MSLEGKFKKLIKDSSSSSNWQEEAANRVANSKSRKNSRLVALRILQVLKERNISQVELAEKLSVSRQHISKIVKGEENFTFETIEKIENALNIELMTILGPSSVIDKSEHKNESIPTPTVSYECNLDVDSLYSLNRVSYISYTDWFIKKFKDDWVKLKSSENFCLWQVEFSVFQRGNIKHLIFPNNTREFNAINLCGNNLSLRQSVNDSFTDIKSIGYRQFENC